MPKTYTPAENFAGNKANINNDAFYRVVTAGRSFGQAIVNVFYYRVGFGLLPGGINFGGAEALANTFKNQVWTDHIRDIMSLSFTLETITVYPYNGNFDPSVSLPFVLTVNEAGIGVGAPAGTASVAIVKYNLEPQTLGLNGWLPPKRGYMAFGPLREGDIDEAGRLTAGAQAYYELQLETISQDLYNPFSLVTFWPIRLRTIVVGGVLTLRGFTDINGFVVRPVASWRESRKQSA